MVATLTEIKNIGRKIRHTRKKETLERYGQQLDQIIIDLDASIAAHTAELESLQTKSYFRHSYGYDQFERDCLEGATPISGYRARLLNITG